MALLSSQFPLVYTHTHTQTDRQTDEPSLIYTPPTQKVASP